MGTKMDFAQFENMDTRLDFTEFMPAVPKIFKSKGKRITCSVEAHKKKTKKPQSNGGLCSLLSPKQYFKSDSSSSDSHLTTTSDSNHNKSDNHFAPLSENFYQAWSN